MNTETSLIHFYNLIYCIRLPDLKHFISKEQRALHLLYAVLTGSHK